MAQSTESTASSPRPIRAEAARAVLMVRPEAFSRNDVTRPTNSFQSTSADDDPERTARAARAEFDNCVEMLEDHGIDVWAFPGRDSIRLPDEVFPNNWFSTHPDGTFVLYPMMAWNRREERRRDILDQLQQQARGFRIDRIVDLTHLEQHGCFLEGTGSLVIDHSNRIAYASLSPRTHVDALREFANETGYGIIPFSAQDERGHAIYHTNVMMSLGEEFAVVCLESIPEVDERVRLLLRLEQSGREVIQLRVSQLRHFCGNLLQLRSNEKRVIAMSKRALKGLDRSQLEALARHGELVAMDIDTIESFGGGSIRCMLAELLLPRKAQNSEQNISRGG